MSDQRLTDARLERDLRDIAPASAADRPPGPHPRRDRRDRAGPRAPDPRSMPPAQRRLVLLAAAMLLIAALAVTGVVGAILLDRRQDRLRRSPQVPSQECWPDVEAPRDLPEYVASAYGDMDELPPVTITAISDDGEGRVLKLRILVDGSGATRVTLPDARRDGTHRVRDLQRDLVGSPAPC